MLKILRVLFLIFLVWVGVVLISQYGKETVDYYVNGEPVSVPTAVPQQPQQPAAPADGPMDDPVVRDAGKMFVGIFVVVVILAAAVVLGTLRGYQQVKVEAQQLHMELLESRKNDPRFKR